MAVTPKTILLVLLAAFLLFIAAISIGLKGGKPKQDDDDFWTGEKK